MMRDTDTGNRNDTAAIDQHISRCQRQYQYHMHAQQLQAQDQPHPIKKVKNNSNALMKSLKRKIKDVRDEIEIQLINLDGNVIFPLRVMYKRHEKKIRCVLCGSIVMIILMLLMLMIFILREDIDNMID